MHRHGQEGGRARGLGQLAHVGDRMEHQAVDNGPFHAQFTFKVGPTVPQPPKKVRQIVYKACKCQAFKPMVSFRVELQHNIWQSAEVGYSFGVEFLRDDY